MDYREENRNLFSVPHGYYLVHSIAADFTFASGIAKEIDFRYNMRQRLQGVYGNYSDQDLDFGSDALDLVGNCLPIANVCNLITKKEGMDRPSYWNICKALNSLHDFLEDNDIECIAMPKICCGKDKMSWPVVRELIQDALKDLEVEVLVCSL